MHPYDIIVPLEQDLGVPTGALDCRVNPAYPMSDSDQSCSFEELHDNKYPDVDRVCSAALEKLLGFILEKPEGCYHSDDGGTYCCGAVHDILDAGALSLC